MITLIHGDDSLTSYQHLTQILNSLPAEQDVTIKDASEIDLTSLRQETSPTDLFGARRVLVIKGLLSGTKSKPKESLIDSLKHLEDSEIILYETKKLSDTSLKPFSKAKVTAFNINPVIFKFLDLLHPGNTRVILLSWNKLLDLGHEPEFVYSMVVRQIRLLIQAKSGASYLKLSPYPKKLLSSQATYFTLNHLLDLHHQLYLIDKKIKTGSSSLPLEQLLLQFFYQI